MMNYNGEKCFSCGSVFGNDDDVVVCPDCGTPYHRECYKQHGECINHPLHESGGAWQRERKSEDVQSKTAEDGSPQAEAQPDAAVCPRCRHINHADTKFCMKCGSLIAGASAEQGANGGAAPHYLGFNPNEDFGGGARLKELTQFVDSNAIYYIPIFKRMKDLGSKVSFNFICLFFPYFYFANRKMWLWAVLTAAVTMLLDIPSLLYVIGEQGAAMPIAFMQDIAGSINANSDLLITLVELCNGAGWVIRILCCLFANWLYMRHAVKAINKVKKFYGGPVSPQRLRSMGGVQPVNILIMAVIAMGLSVIVYFAVMFILVFLQQMAII